MSWNTEENEFISHTDVLMHKNQVCPFIGQCNDVSDEVLHEVEGAKTYLTGHLCCKRQKKSRVFQMNFSGHYKVLVFCERVSLSAHIATYKVCHVMKFDH